MSDPSEVKWVKFWAAYGFPIGAAFGCVASFIALSFAYQIPFGGRVPPATYECVLVEKR